MKPYRKIKRNYSKPFFSKRRHGRAGLPFLITILTIVSAIIGVLAISSFLYGELEFAALDLLGIAPEPTLYASEHAHQGIRLYNEGQVEAALTNSVSAASTWPSLYSLIPWWACSLA